MKPFSPLLSFGAAALLAFPFLARGAADVSFYGVFKARKFNQTTSGAPAIGTGLPYRFDAVASGNVTNATVTPPGGTAQLLTFDPLNQWLNFEAKFSSQSFLDSSVPSGTYTLAMSTVNQGLKTETLNLTAETFPVAPHISNWTAGQSINPTLDFKLTWDTFTGGTTNDYILVLMGDQATGTVTFRSPSPFLPGALNGTNTSVVIPASSLQPNTVYQVEITFVKMNSIDTTSYPGAKGIVGFNSFTDSGLTTTTAPNPIQASLSFRSFANAGNFFAETNATASFPVSFNNYRTELTMTGTTNFAALNQVLITGPPGSGLTNTACATFSQSGSNGFYFSPKVTQPAIAPAGTWSASYAGSPYTFPEPGLDLAANLVVPVPIVGLSNGILQGVSWDYFDPSGNRIAGTPSMMFSIQFQAFNPAGANIYNSAALPPATTSLSLGTNVLAWTNVDALRFVYSDSASDLYLITYANVLNPAPAQLLATGFSTNGFGLQLSGQAGQTYAVQFSSDLLNWSNLLTTNMPPAVLEIFDPLAGGSLPRFYRTRTGP